MLMNGKKMATFVVLAGSLMTTTVFAASNIMQGAAIEGPYENKQALTDGKIDGAGIVSAVSEKVGGKSLRLEMDLGAIYYINKINIYWEEEGIPKNFMLWFSKSGVDNTAMKDLNGMDGKSVGKLRLQTFELNDVYTRHLTLFVPDNVALSKGDKVKIREIQVFRNDNPKITISDIQSVVGDSDIILSFKTNIDAQSKITYGIDDYDGKLLPPVMYLFSRKAHAKYITGLKPGTKYRFKIDASAKGAQSDITKFINFTTKKRNLAFKQPIIGTFTNLPEGSVLQKERPPLDRIVDNEVSYWASCAVSGSIPKGDQFVIVDLWKEYEITEIITYWRSLSYPKEFNLLVSKDNKTWEKVGEKLDARNGFFDDIEPPKLVHKHTFASRKARYIKLEVPKGSQFFAKHANWEFVSLFEIKAF